MRQVLQLSKARQPVVAQIQTAQGSRTDAAGAQVAHAVPGQLQGVEVPEGGHVRVLRDAVV